MALSIFGISADEAGLRKARPGLILVAIILGLWGASTVLPSVLPHGIPLGSSESFDGVIYPLPNGEGRFVTTGEVRENELLRASGRQRVIGTCVDLTPVSPELSRLLEKQPDPQTSGMRIRLVARPHLNTGGCAVQFATAEGSRTPWTRYLLVEELLSDKRR